MLSIKENVTSELVIKKSKFISLLFRVDSKEDVLNILNKLKTEYKGASHYCYAYIIENNEYCTDDSEPSGTAGIPILNCLKGNNLDHVLCVVIRYFGGIKLGTGGLLRAYSKSSKDVILKANIVELNKGKCIYISFNYDNSKVIDNLLVNTNIISKEYNEFVEYKVNIKDSVLEEIYNNLINYLIDYKEINDILI